MTITSYQTTSPTLLSTVVKFIEKIYTQKQERCTVYIRDETYLEIVDNMLWTASKISFLPHGQATKIDKAFHARQPIWLTPSLENINTSSFLITTEKIPPSELFKNLFQHYVFFFDKNENTYLSQFEHISRWVQEDTGWQKAS